jgi:hypothetical protein
MAAPSLLKASDRLGEVAPGQVDRSPYHQHPAVAGVLEPRVGQALPEPLLRSSGSDGSKGRIARRHPRPGPLLRVGVITVRAGKPERTLWIGHPQVPGTLDIIQGDHLGLQHSKAVLSSGYAAMSPDMELSRSRGGSTSGDLRSAHVASPSALPPAFRARILEPARMA